MWEYESKDPHQLYFLACNRESEIFHCPWTLADPKGWEKVLSYTSFIKLTSTFVQPQWKFFDVITTLFSINEFLIQNNPRGRIISHSLVHKVTLSIKFNV